VITVFIDIALRLLAVVGICLALTDVIGTSLYDLRETKRLQQQALHPHARRYRARPLISIIIVTQNNEATIVGCLESTLKSSYRHIEIIVADNASGDDTKRLVRSFQAVHPKQPVKLFAKRRSGSTNRVIREAYKAYGHGEIVVTMQSSALLDKQALR
jgi:cellulose synthase/poly-beta-1,6-N-acetylglucosamine synthase-like glycosyltransferase